jgi:hypothetical protein
MTVEDVGHGAIINAGNVIGLNQPYKSTWLEANENSNQPDLQKYSQKSARVPTSLG